MKSVFLPLQFILSLVLLVSCLHEVAYNEDVIFNELCKALAAVALLSMLAAASGNASRKTNSSIRNENKPYENN